MKQLKVQGGETASLPNLIHRYQLEQAQSDTFQRAQYLAQLYHSTALDGHSLTLSGIASLSEIETNRSACTPAEWMLLDYIQGQKVITGWATRREPLTLGNVQLLGACVMQHTGGITNHFLYPVDSRQGEWRTHELSGAGGVYERPHKIQKALQELIKHTNTNLQQSQTIRQVYETSFRLHAELIRIHPFAEGNGRVARLLMNYVQQFNRLPQSVIFIEDRPAYLAALSTTFRTKVNEPFYAFMFGQLTKLVTPCPSSSVSLYSENPGKDSGLNNQ
ncbi:Fic family protein [Spirosoma endophyticum]|uniref:Fic/DOC family protein n=1 Tax=Spirosoma endophyticum TaxID=662367 RepID=A0A1I2BBJ1_9BACT|nr:Fic family protein [Spirosoma endophyticum]SFE53515.1 Fic/DOC family protein [Spirosoma endophyticum]